MIYGTMMEQILPANKSRPTRFRILTMRPLQGYSWVDGRLTKTEVTSRPESIWLEVWPSMSKCAQKESKAAMATCTPEEENARYFP